MGESKIKQGYKKTPVGMIPEDWSVKIFGECFKHLRAYTFSRNQLNYVEKEDAVYNIHYGDIHSTFPKNLLDVKKDIDLIPIIISSELEAPELLKDGDLIMADASEDYKGIGQSIELINVGDRKIVSGTHTFPLRPVEKFAPKYAGYIFSNFNTHKEVKRIATGISVYGISKANLSKIKLPIPPLPEQNAIADCLSTWDKGIEKLSALITSKKEQKKGLMQGLFSGKLKVENGELVKVEDEKLWLKEWKEVRLGQMFKQVKRPINWDDNEYYKLISVRRRSGGIFHLETLKGGEIRTKNLYDVKEGDFLISKMQVLHGASAIVSKENEGMKVSGSYITLVPKKPKTINMS